jgi:hypothetical protein
LIKESLRQTQAVKKETSRISISWKLSAQILSAAVFLYPAVYAMDSASSQVDVHGQITHDALTGSISEGNLKLIADADSSQDAAGSEAARERRRHFDGSSINATLNYIFREKNKALVLAAEADTEPQSRLDALRHFGMMLHAVQDFYLRSNYVEQQLAQEANQADPYNIALVDWNKVAAGAFSAAKHGESDDPLNKDNSTVGGGKTSVAGKITYHSVAKDLAVRETQRQWNLFETLVRNRCGDRAPAVLAALRQASTPTASQIGAIKESTQTILGNPEETKMDDHNPDSPDVDQGP